MRAWQTSSFMAGVKDSHEREVGARMVIRARLRKDLYNIKQFGLYFEKSMNF